MITMNGAEVRLSDTNNDQVVAGSSAQQLTAIIQGWTNPAALSPVSRLSSILRNPYSISENLNFAMTARLVFPS